MLMKSLVMVHKTFQLSTVERRKSAMISWYVSIQCLAVFVGAYTVLGCVWNPDNTDIEVDKVARVMYLYDSKACHYQLSAERGLINLMLSNDTLGGHNIYPIKWTPGVLTVSARLSASFRQHINTSIAIHGIWLLSAVCFGLIVRKLSEGKITLFKFIIKVFLYVSIAVVVFDISMTIIYIVHIQKSISYSMVIRHAGWSLNLKLVHPERFGGWLVIVASVCWLRGILFLALNVYCCKFVKHIRTKVLKKEARKRLSREGHRSIPEPTTLKIYDKNVLYYRAGEDHPFNGDEFE